MRFRANAMAFDEDTDIPGFAKMFVKGKVSVTSTPGAWEALEDEVSLEDFLACSEVKISALEELASSRAPKGKKGASAEALKDKLQDAGLLGEGAGSYQLRVKKQ